MKKLKQLAELVGGQVVGDPEVEIRRVAPIDQAQEGDITFVSNQNTCRCCNNAGLRPSSSHLELKQPG